MGLGFWEDVDGGEEIQRDVQRAVGLLRALVKVLLWDMENGGLGGG